MVYLIFDTNIWLSFILNAGIEQDELDIIEIWIGKNLVTILLPEVILTEWDRNKEEYRNNKITEFKTFFKSAKGLLSSDISLNAYTLDVQKEIVDKQIQRIEKIIRDNTSNVQRLHLTEIITTEVLRRGVEKIYPFDKDRKNNVGDTIIFVSFVEFLKSNECKSYFVSKNVNDFFENENKKRNETKVIDFYEKEWLPEKEKGISLEELLFLFAERKHKLPIDVKVQFDSLKSQAFATI